jgi:hypothetical protein
MNEREIANGFSAAWSEHFPMLSPTFIVAFNQAFVRPIFGTDGIVSAVPSRVKTAHPDVLAEFGFRLAASAIEAGISVKAAFKDASITEAANSAAARRILEFRPALALDMLRLDLKEQQEGFLLAFTYEQFLKLWPSETVVFSPKVRGNGVLTSCFADLSVGKTLYEVKTVSRPFQSRDLRQLLVYLALQSATGEPRWEHGGLLNPRVGVFCSFSIEWLVTRLSGGRPSKLVFTDFIQALSRDVVHDSRF